MTTVLEVRQALVDHGFTPIPVIGKVPPFEKWQKVENVTSKTLEGWRRNWPRATNTGILTRVTPTLDLDVLNEPAAIAAKDLIREQFEEYGYILERIGRAPKRAIPFRALQPFAKLTTNFVVAAGADAEKIEFLCDGQQVVAHGIHPDTLKPYNWFGGDPTMIAYDDLPCISADRARQLQDDIAALLVRDFGYVVAPGRPVRKGNGKPGNHARDWQLLIDGILVGSDLHANSRDLAAKMARAGTDGGAIVNFLRGLMNSSAAPHDQRWQDRYDDLPRQVDSIQAKIEREQAAAAAPTPSTGAPPPPPPHQPPGTGPTPSPAAGQPQPSPQPVKGAYMKGKATWACNAGNVLLALKQEPEFIGAFGYDEMLRCEILLRPLLASPANFVPRPLTDADVITVQARLQWMGFRRLGKDTTHDAINRHALEHRFHPVRDYLNQLTWDGKSRLRTWLADCFGAEQNEYSEEIGTMFLISMVARIYRPGCKVDCMMIVEGEQGLLKSSACRILAGDYFSDQLPDITGKEAFQHLRGKWLIEVAELRAYSRAAIDHFKEFLVRDTERYRPPWGRKEVHEPRQCCFVGTTNKALYLKDETGNRRFWPLKTGEINLDRLRTDRDQLFAQAVALYRGGVPWWPDREFEQQIIRDEQEARYEPDAWEQPIRKYLDGLSAPKRTTIWDLAKGALGYVDNQPLMIAGVPHHLPPERGTPINRLGPFDQRRITSILVHLKWVSKRKNSERWWEPG